MFVQNALDCDERATLSSSRPMQICCLLNGETFTKISSGFKGGEPTEHGYPYPPLTYSLG